VDTVSGEDRLVGKRALLCNDDEGKDFFVKLRFKPQRSQDPTYLLSHIHGFTYEYTELNFADTLRAISGEMVSCSSQTGVLGSHTPEEDFICQFSQPVSDYSRNGRKSSKSDHQACINSQRLLRLCTTRRHRAALLTAFPTLDIKRLMLKVHAAELTDKGTFSARDLSHLLSCQDQTVPEAVFFPVVTKLETPTKASFPQSLGSLSLMSPNYIKPCHMQAYTADIDIWEQEAREYSLHPKEVKKVLPQGSAAASLLQKTPQHLVLRSFFSPISRINIPSTFKVGGRIPEEAIYFAWSYPFLTDWDPLDGCVESCCASHSSFSSVARDPDAAFLQVGGFVYLDACYNPVHILAAVPDDTGAGALKFGAPQHLDMDWVKLARSNDAHPVTIRSLHEKGVVEFFWAPPGLEGQTNGGGPRDNVFGGFVYVGVNLSNFERSRSRSSCI